MDLIDDDVNNINDANNASEPWFCYRVILVGLLAVFICVLCFVLSCQSFRYDSLDEDGVIYYGIRGVTDQSTGRCVDWEFQKFIDWNQYWTQERMPLLFKLGVSGIIFVVGIFVAWVAYGVILKKKRDRRRVHDNPPPKSTTCAPIAPTVIIGVCLIGAGMLVFTTIMGKCSKINDTISPEDWGCNLHTWSGLALTVSITLCSMGGILVFYPKCCCIHCRCTTFLRTQLIGS